MLMFDPECLAPAGLTLTLTLTPAGEEEAITVGEDQAGSRARVKG